MIWQKGKLFRNILIKGRFKFFIDRVFYPFIYFNLESLAYDIPESLKKVPLLRGASRYELRSAPPPPPLRTRDSRCSHKHWSRACC